jgi:hypothetical protein
VSELAAALINAVMLRGFASHAMLSMQCRETLQVYSITAA